MSTGITLTRLNTSRFMVKKAANPDKEEEEMIKGKKKKIDNFAMRDSARKDKMIEGGILTRVNMTRRRRTAEQTAKNLETKTELKVFYEARN